MVEFSSMQTTIDGTGRLVIPKRIRDLLGLRGGEPLEVEVQDGAIRVSRRPRNVVLVEGDEGILTARLDPPLPLTTPEEVRDALERTRR